MSTLDLFISTFIVLLLLLFICLFCFLFLQLMNQCLVHARPASTLSLSYNPSLSIYYLFTLNHINTLFLNHMINSPFFHPTPHIHFLFRKWYNLVVIWDENSWFDKYQSIDWFISGISERSSTKLRLHTNSIILQEAPIPFWKHKV